MASPLSAQALTRETRLASADLRADLALLRRAYETLHPGLYRYNTPVEIDQRFDAVDRYFATDRTLGEAFLALTRLTAAVRCGHSHPNFFNQPKAIQDALFEADDRLPVEFMWLGGHMVVTADRTPDGVLPRGTVIESLNGVPTSAILDSLLPLARADGGNDAKRVAYLGVQGAERWHPFDVLYPLVFPLREPRHTLRIRRPGEVRSRTVTVAALPAEARRQVPVAGGQTGSAAPLWSVAVEDGVGVLRMPTWVLYNSDWDARSWLAAVLERLLDEGVPDLVIDIRGNEGGDTIGNELLSHFLGAPVTLPGAEQRVRYRRVPADLDPILDTWDDSFRDWGSSAIGPVDSLFYRLVLDGEDGSAGTTVVPLAPTYRGRVWVLVDATNSSATFQFALAAKRTGAATLVGQPTGGNRRGINGGSFFFVRLPRTHLEVDLPLIGGFPTTEEPDAGVEPDVLVIPSVADIAAGRDPVLATVRRLIARARAG